MCFCSIFRAGRLWHCPPPKWRIRVLCARVSSALMIVIFGHCWLSSLVCYSQYLGPTNNIPPTLSSAKENILLWCQHLAYAMSISASKPFKSWDRPLPLLWKTSYGSHVVLWSAELVNDRSIQITSSCIITFKVGWNHYEIIVCCTELDFDDKRSDCEKPFVPWDKSRGNHCLKLVNALQFRCWDK